MRSGDFAAAVVSYSRTLLSLLESEREGGERETHRLARALVLSNRGAARLSLGRFSKAAADSLQAIKLCPFWWRPWERLARARAGAGDARGGVRACREGSEAAAIASAAATKGLPSLPTRERVEAQAALRREADAIALEAAHEGRFDGFDGAVLEVSREERKSSPPLSTSGKEKKTDGRKKKKKKSNEKRSVPPSPAPSGSASPPLLERTSQTTTTTTMAPHSAGSAAAAVAAAAETETETGTETPWPWPLFAPRRPPLPRRGSGGGGGRQASAPCTTPLPPRRTGT